VSKRAIRPRPVVVVAPLAVSTETCLQLGGIMPHKLRALLTAHPDIPRSQVGHTLIVEPEHFRELLARLRVEADDDAADVDDEPGDDVPTTPEAVMRRLGRERVA
jgi:hypothetical protein